MYNRFAEALSNQNGYQLAETLSPNIPNEQLRKIFKSQNAQNIKNALRRGLQVNVALALEHQTIQGWVDVYAAYWNATGVLLTARELEDDSSKVGTS